MSELAVLKVHIALSSEPVHSQLQCTVSLLPGWFALYCELALGLPNPMRSCFVLSYRQE